MARWNWYSRLKHSSTIGIRASYPDPCAPSALGATGPASAVALLLQQLISDDEQSHTTKSVMSELRNGSACPLGGHLNALIAK